VEVDGVERLLNEPVIQVDGVTRSCKGGMTSLNSPEKARRVLRRRGDHESKQRQFHYGETYLIPLRSANDRTLFLLEPSFKNAYC
jgi:hypothetical protein